jgi:hypothetical protein
MHSQSKSQLTFPLEQSYQTFAAFDNFHMKDCHLIMGLCRKHHALSLVTIFEKVWIVICCVDKFTTDPHVVVALFPHQHSWYDVLADVMGRY